MPAEAGIRKHFDYPGFRVALAIASLPGMTIDLCNELIRAISHFMLLIIAQTVLSAGEKGTGIKEN
jgi:hypothetical protein